ncbi:hypothetical protein DIJ97_19880 [Salmonella enterica]|nr:hypothetical protein [Salmonella enterica]
MEYLNVGKDCETGRNNLIGFFPGLGSRAAYQNISDNLLFPECKEVERIYREAAIAMGYGDRPKKMLINSTNLPSDKMEQQGFIGACFLTHNLVLFAKFRQLAQEQNINLNFQAYSGESFGIINSAVASGALSISDGVKIANFFTPYILLASEKHSSRFCQAISNYYPNELKQNPLISEHYYVLALCGRAEQLNEVSNALQDEFHYTEVEKHKIYSYKQINIYVRASIKSCFDIFMKNYPDIKVVNLKEPTIFLTHSAQLASLKDGLERFLLDQSIVFHTPHTPIIANHCKKVIFHGEEVRAAILALLDQTMIPASTARMADEFDADAIVEFGIGNKSIQMLHDNYIITPSFSFTGNVDNVMPSMKILHALSVIRNSKNISQACSGISEWLTVIRNDDKYEAYFSQKVLDAIQQVAHFTLNIKGTMPASIDSIYRYSWCYRNYLQPGEFVLMARLKRNIEGDESDKNQTYADLKILGTDGVIRYQRTPFIIHAEKTLFYFSNLDELSNNDIFYVLQDMKYIPGYDEICKRIEMECNYEESLNRLLQLRRAVVQPETQAIRRIIMQLLLFELIKIHKPGLAHYEKICFGAHDFIGWLTCLLTTKAASFEAIEQLCHDYYSIPGRKISPWRVIKNFTSKLTNVCMPILAISGLPLMASKDLEINTYKILLNYHPTESIQFALNCNLSIITLDSTFSNFSIKNTHYKYDVILINSVQDIWHHHPDSVLEQREREAQSYLTDEYQMVSTYASQRNLLCSTINSYIEANEVPVRFCQGGSESMTMFIQRFPHEPVIVRKILSEALTAAKWSPDGKGVMLPPFVKAARQVDYLRALPEYLKPYFPEVYSITSREILAPVNRKHVEKTVCKEVIYEMSMLEGEEVSQFVRNNNLATPIIARLYEITLTFLRDKVHCERRRPVTGNTLESSYFKKIEDRLILCQRTTPNVFSQEFIGSDKIVINGNEYYNIKSLLHVFRSHPEYQSVLEPRYHSLVIGDTNTENIKIGNTAPLLAIQSLISKNSAEDIISKALANINIDNIQLKFLDPRAIGFQSEGANCRDDYMYDNKPWHNSIGHYDEIHNEMFTLTMDLDSSGVPIVNIQFTENNEYQRVYKISDCAQKNINPLTDSTVIGIERYFSQVMNTVYGSVDSESVYFSDDPYWLIRFVFIMGTHFAAMPPFHFTSELDGTIKDSVHCQRRPVAIYCEGIKWLNWALEILQGKRDQFLGVGAPLIEQGKKKVI